MSQVSRSPSPTLPGPATAPGAHIPPQSNSYQMHPLPPTTSAPSVDEKARFDQAWKYEGYQEFSKWMASDDDFFVIRRFESLNANTILWMQHHIARLEQELAGIHRSIEESKPSQNLMNNSFTWDAKYMQRRTQILRELSQQLLHYNQFIDAFSKVRARPRAEKRQVDNVIHWLENGAIDADEQSFVKKASDLMSINSRSRTPLGSWLESCRKVHQWRIFRAKEVEGLHIKSAATMYSSTQRFDTLTTAFIILMGLAMLLAPMWWLEFVSTSETRLKIITGFICVFITIMSTATVNRPFEVVAATAAYAAVLMVFMQIDGSATSGSTQPPVTNLTSV